MARGPVDPGLQIERTTLSWRRTLLSCVVAMAGVLKFVVKLSVVHTLVLSLVAVVVTTTAVVIGRVGPNVPASFVERDARRGAEDPAGHSRMTVFSMARSGADADLVALSGLVALVALFVDFFG